MLTAPVLLGTFLFMWSRYSNSIFSGCVCHTRPICSQGSLCWGSLLGSANHEARSQVSLAKLAARGHGQGPKHQGSLLGLFGRACSPQLGPTARSKDARPGSLPGLLAMASSQVLMPGPKAKGSQGLVAKGSALGTQIQVLLVRGLIPGTQC